MEKKLEDQFIQHFKHVKQSIDTIVNKYNLEGLLIDSGHQRIKFLDDSPYPLKMNPHFLYQCPLPNHADCFIWHRKNQKNVLFFPNKVDFWHKMPEFPQGKWVIDCFEFIPYVEKKEILNKLNEKNQIQKIMYLGEFPEDYPNNEWAFHLYNDKNILIELHYLRTTKSTYEQICLQDANHLAAKAHIAAKDAFFNNLSEMEIHIEYLKALNNTENQLPYDNIVAINESCGILHYTALEKNSPKNNDRHSFLIDAGASVNGYHSDITRTYAFRDGLFKEILTEFDKLQQKIIKELKPKDLYTDLHIKSHHMIGKLLQDFDIITDKNIDTQKLIDEKITHKFFPHGLGHFLGLQVHDVGGIKKDPPQEHPYLRCTMEINEGHYFTIEPGLYFIPSLLKELHESNFTNLINWTKIDQLRKFGGIRIENNICLASTGFQDFTKIAFEALR